MFKDLAIWATFALSASAAAIDSRQTSCSSYTIINTRGTGEAQGQSAGFRTMNANIQRQLSGGKIYNTVYPASVSQNSASGTTDIINTRGTGEAQGQSAGFRTMNANVQRQLSGGKIYNTVYPASFSQNSASGTTDIINKITSTLRSNPAECFILEGYSQGAAATVDALPRLTGNAFNAVKGVFLIGNPDHKSGLSCNVDNNGGTTTRNVNGISAFGSAGIPSNWVGKTLDVCIYGDGVCDTTHGSGINAQHLQYPRDSATQNLGTNFVVGKLRGS